MSFRDGVAMSRQLEDDLEFYEGLERLDRQVFICNCASLAASCIGLGGSFALFCESLARHLQFGAVVWGFATVILFHVLCKGFIYEV